MKLEVYDNRSYTQGLIDGSNQERLRLKAKLLEELDKVGVGRDTYYHVTDVKLRKIAERVFKEGA